MRKVRNSLRSLALYSDSGGLYSMPQLHNDSVPRERFVRRVYAHAGRRDLDTVEDRLALLLRVQGHSLSSEKFQCLACAAAITAVPSSVAANAANSAPYHAT